MDLHAIEVQLKKRLNYTYQWRQKQNDRMDGETNFVYRISDFDSLLAHLSEQFPNREDVFDYALNRWYNFWSAQAVEHIFSTSPRVIPARNQMDRYVDFYIDGIGFDHKTSVFPKGFSLNLSQARQDPEDLILWFYNSQSQQQRKHLKNRLFIVLYANDGQHWKLKAEVQWLKGLVDDYLAHFSPEKLHRLNLSPQTVTLSDIIWGIREDSTARRIKS